MAAAGIPVVWETRSTPFSQPAGSPAARTRAAWRTAPEDSAIVADKVGLAVVGHFDFALKVVQQVVAHITRSSVAEKRAARTKPESVRGAQFGPVAITSSCAAAAFIRCRWAAAPYRKVRQGAAAHLLP